MKYLAVDYGLKHIGLAISHEGKLAEPLAQLENMGDHLVVGKLAKLCKEQGIDKVVIGISENLMGERTQAFVTQLTTLVDIPVESHDETLSSMVATKHLAQSGAKRKKRQTKIHQTAAAVILQSYLDENGDTIESNP